MGHPQGDAAHSPQAQLIAQAIGQAFAVAYSQFLRESGINPSQVGAHTSQGATGSSSGYLHNGDLDHFSNSENCREVSEWVGHPPPAPDQEALMSHLCPLLGGH